GAGQLTAGQQVAAVESAPVPAARLLFKLVALQRPTCPQPGVGPAGGAPGRFRALLGTAPGGRRSGRVLEVAGDRAADQAGDTRPVYPAPARPVGPARAPADRPHHPVRHHAAPSQRRATPPPAAAPAPPPAGPPHRRGSRPPQAQPRPPPPRARPPPRPPAPRRGKAGTRA